MGNPFKSDSYFLPYDTLHRASIIFRLITYTKNASFYFKSIYIVRFLNSKAHKRDFHVFFPRKSWNILLGYNCLRKATRSFFSCAFMLICSTKLKNSTVSSSVSKRPSCKYGGESLIPRKGNVLIGPSARMY